MGNESSTSKYTRTRSIVGGYNYLPPIQAGYINGGMKRKAESGVDDRETTRVRHIPQAVHFYANEEPCSNLEKICLSNMYKGYNFKRHSGHAGSGIYFVIDGFVDGHQLTAPEHRPSEGGRYVTDYPWKSPFMITTNDQSFQMETTCKLLLAYVILNSDNLDDLDDSDDSDDDDLNLEEHEDVNNGMTTWREAAYNFLADYQETANVKNLIKIEDNNSYDDDEEVYIKPTVTLNHNKLLKCVIGNLRNIGIINSSLKAMIKNVVKTFWETTTDSRNQPLSSLLHLLGYDGVVDVDSNDLSRGSVYFDAKRFLNGLQDTCNDTNAAYCSYKT